MNIIQKELLRLLKYGINGNKTKICKHIKLEKIFELAEEHKIKGLIYSAIEWDEESKTINKGIIDDWRKDTFVMSLSQSNHLNQVCRVFNDFNKNGIDLIALKGLVVRDLYPIPDLRTMSDADILVKEEDLKKAGEILESIGYIKNDDKDEHGAHIVYIAPRYYPIEVHWTLINEDFYKGSKEFEKDIWNNAVKVNVKGADVYGLSLEDLAFHLCSHMAVHIAYGGFGLRQLCDLVLLVDKKGEEIDWDKFLKIVYESGIEKFVFVIFNICNQLFDMEIPFSISNEIKFNKSYINILINDIFKDGVYASKDMHVIFANEFAFDKEEASTIKKLNSLIFPSSKNIGSKYNYVKKYKILLPLAWMHHIFSGIFNTKYNFNDKVKFIFLTAYNSNKKDKLLRWLEL